MLKRISLFVAALVLLLTASALAESEADWNAECNWITNSTATLYSAYQSDIVTDTDLFEFAPIGSLSSGSYVKVLASSGGMRQIRYYVGGSTGTAWVSSSSLTRIGGGSSSSGSSSGSGSRGPQYSRTWAKVPVTYSDGETTLDVTIQTLGVAMSRIYADGEMLTVPTSSLSWETEADDQHRIAVVYAPSTGEGSLRDKASKFGKVLKKCKTGRVVLVLRKGDVYSRVVYEGVEGLILNSVLNFYETPAEEDIQLGVLCYEGRTNSSATISVYLEANSRRKIRQYRVGNEVPVMSQKGKWAEIDIDGWHGFVRAPYVEVDGEPLADAE